MEAPDKTVKDCQVSFKLKIANKKELHQFLREILPEFVRVVDPRETGFLDSLYAASLITETDNDSLSGKNVFTRKAQARKLLMLLHKLPVEDFLTEVAPEICAKFPHIIPRAFIASVDKEDTLAKEGNQQNDECLRHAIQTRVRSTTMADMLYHGGFLDFEIYEYIVSSDTAAEVDSVWATIFEAFLDRTEEEAEILLNAVKSMMKRHRLDITNDLSDAMSRGMPCTCSNSKAAGRPPKSADEPARKVNDWLSASRFSLNRSSGSSRTRVDMSTASPPSTARHADTVSLSGSGSSGSSTIIAITDVLNSFENSGYAKGQTLKEPPSGTVRYTDPQIEKEHPGDIMRSADPHCLKEHPSNTAGYANLHVSGTARYADMQNLKEPVPDMARKEIKPQDDTTVFIPDEKTSASTSIYRTVSDLFGEQSADHSDVESSCGVIFDDMSGKKESQYFDKSSPKKQGSGPACSERQTFHNTTEDYMLQLARRKKGFTVCGLGCPRCVKKACSCCWDCCTFLFKIVLCVGVPILLFFLFSIPAVFFGKYFGQLLIYWLEWVGIV